MSTGMPESLAVDADEAYFDELEKSDDTRWTDGGVRVSVEMHSRHVAYAKVWQAGREPLSDLLEASLKLLNEISEMCEDGNRLSSGVLRDVHRLARAIEESR